MLESLFFDLRLAIRGLQKSPSFLLVAVSSLALGIGANIAIFSFVNAILLKKLPVPDAERLVQISEFDGTKPVYTARSYPFIHALDKRNGVLDGVFGRFPVRVNLTSSGIAEPLNGEVVTGRYFKTLGIQPALGRFLGEEDVTAGAANPVCVISYALWQQRFGGDERILGQKLMLNSHPYTVVGVSPRGFNGAQLDSRIDMQLPVSRMGDFMGGFFATGPGGAMWKSPGMVWLQPFGRLKRGMTRARAEDQLQTVTHEIEKELATAGAQRRSAGDKTRLRLVDGSGGMNYSRRAFSQPVTVLMGVVGLVLLIACANLANLLLARANARQKEFAVRLSLGASRGRLIRQLMVESMVIAISGGALGLLLSFWIIHTLLAFLNSGLAAGSGLQASLDSTVLTFSILLSLATAMLFGLAPAWQSVRLDVLPQLKQVAGGSHAYRQGLTVRKALIVLQLALSLVMLFAAGLFTRTLSHLQTIDLGFAPTNVIALSVDPAMSGHSPADTERIFDDILGRLRTQPGITAAGVAVVSPLEGSMITLDAEVPGHIETKSDIKPAFNMVSPGYFATLNQPVLRGRDFTERDKNGAAQVAIVNDRFVAQYMPGRDPVGQHFKAAGKDREIVGMVKTARYQSIREEPTPQVYLPTKQATSSGYTLLVRTRGDARAATAQVEHAIRSIDAKLPIYNVRTLEQQLEQGISSERILGFLSALFGALATLLCAIGLYGIIGYGVSRRTREIGVRLAIGARKRDVASLFVREVALLLGAGILVGVPAALAAARLVKTMLFGLEATDIPTLTFSIGLLACAGLVSIILPVRRATAVEPMEALRYE